MEGEAKEVDESVLIDAIKAGHEAIKVQIQAQMDLQAKVGKEKRALAEAEENDEVKQLVADMATDKILEVARGAHNKADRKAAFKEVKTNLKEAIKEQQGEEWYEENGSFVSKYYNKLQKATIRKMVLDEQTRLDGRKYDQVRDIWTEIDYLPSAHGSAIFNRGETQCLSSVTLGTKTDKQMVDKAQEQYYDNFILHYNFPAYSVGETKPMRGPGRREVGHANLAGRSIRQVLPEEQPYTIRIVADVLESNGSSSMATVCSGSMALMDAGIQLTAPVSGIAMGMISEGGKHAILSDILGDEDAIGDMDFKVTGTRNGITACQMDIKIDGLPYSTLEEALAQAREGRLHILDRMAESIDKPAADLKPHAPRIVQIVIDKSFIGAVIGPGGKIIQDIQEQSGAQVNIEEIDGKGYVSVSSSDKASIDKAMARINEITYTPSVGDVYDSVVATVMPYGVFVDFKGKSGLLHVSEMSYERIDNVEDHFSEGDDVKVKLIGIDERTGKLRLSAKALMEKPEGYVEPAPRERRGGDRGDRRGGGRGPGGPRRGGDRRGGDRRNGRGDRRDDRNDRD